MQAVFRARRDYTLDIDQQRLLHLMIQEACEIRIDALQACLEVSNRTKGSLRKRHILDCLKVIDTKEAWKAVEAHAQTREASAGYARELLLGKQGETVTLEKAVVIPAAPGVGKGAWHNPFEFNAQYILIKGGTYTYSGDRKKHEVKDIRFAKYPVTNRCYRRFLGYLEGKESDLQGTLSSDRYTKGLRAEASGDKGFVHYLNQNPRQLHDLLYSEYVEEKRFKGDDQPAVGITWYAARAYCVWLSELERVSGEQMSEGLQVVYRLPTELEWEWAAGGGKRIYPWGKDEPTDKLANFGGNVGTTTPVRQYPDGATPECLMDMAGNVWEWTENYCDNDRDVVSLRGGAWSSNPGLLRCCARCVNYPNDTYDNVGFRVVRSQL